MGKKVHMTPWLSLSVIVPYFQILLCPLIMPLSHGHETVPIPLSRKQVTKLNYKWRGGDMHIPTNPPPPL